MLVRPWRKYQTTYGKEGQGVGQHTPARASLKPQTHTGILREGDELFQRRPRAVGSIMHSCSASNDVMVRRWQRRVSHVEAVVSCQRQNSLLHGHTKEARSTAVADGAWVRPKSDSVYSPTPQVAFLEQRRTPCLQTPAQRLPCSPRANDEGARWPLSLWVDL